MKKIGLLASALACLGILFFSTQTTSNPTNPPQTAKNPESLGRDTSANSQPVRNVTTASPKPVTDVKGGAAQYAQRAGNEAVTPDGKRYPLRTYRALAMPNDPSADQSWVAAANMGAAWDIPRGGSPTLLAIIDTGFALDHEELSGRWYTNVQESVNGVDDDGNGLVDDVRGWDFANVDSSVQAEAEGRHGTNVAGVAAATGNNSKGMAGVDWGVTILPLQALDEDGAGYNVDVANAILYAADKGADVINLSLGSPEPDPLVREAVQYAISLGSIVVAAAGNDGCDCMVYPANYPEVLAVGASRSDGTPAGFSSYGNNLDVLAPGVNLYTSDWQPGNPAAYASVSGTSLATPVISGLLSRLKSLQPGATPIQLVAALTENTNRLNLDSINSRNNQLGFGLVNGGQASQRLANPYTPTQLYGFGPVSFGNGLSPQYPAEAAGTAYAYQCDGRPGTTPLYELIKSGQTFFSASQSETQQAIEQDYTAYFFSYACVTMPHDRMQSVRSLNLYKEFRNY